MLQLEKDVKLLLGSGSSLNINALIMNVTCNAGSVQDCHMEFRLDPNDVNYIKEYVNNSLNRDFCTISISEPEISGVLVFKNTGFRSKRSVHEYTRVEKIDIFGKFTQNK